MVLELLKDWLGLSYEQLVGQEVIVPDSAREIGTSRAGPVTCIVLTEQGHARVRIMAHLTVRELVRRCCGNKKHMKEVFMVFPARERYCCACGGNSLGTRTFMQWRIL